MTSVWTYREPVLRAGFDFATGKIVMQATGCDGKGYEELGAGAAVRVWLPPRFVRNMAEIDLDRESISWILGG